MWAELVYPSIGIWMSSIRDPELLAAGCRAINDWAFEFQRRSLRHVPTATIPLLTRRARRRRGGARRGHRASRPRTSRSRPPTDEDWNDSMWEPLWAALRGDRPRHRLPRRHRAARRVDVPRRVLPRPGWRAPQLRGDHLRRPARGHEDDRHRRVRPAPVAQGDRVRGRRHLGTVRRRPPRRGLPPARVGGAAAARPSAERVPVRERVRARSSTTVRPSPRTGRWAGATSAGAATTRTSRGRSGTRRRRSTSSSTTSTPTTRRRITVGAFEELFPHVPPAPASSD